MPLAFVNLESSDTPLASANFEVQRKQPIRLHNSFDALTEDLVVLNTSQSERRRLLKLLIAGSGGCRASHLRSLGPQLD